MDVEWGEAIGNVVEVVRIAMLLAVVLLVIPVISLMAASMGPANLEEEWQ